MISLQFIAFVMFMGTFVPAAEGGTCWARYNPQTGKCVALVKLKVTDEDCCSRNGLSFTEDDMSREEIFRSIIIHDGVSNCIPCSSIGRDVCEGIACSRDEVCIAENGQPLCKCEPDCSDVDMDTPVCDTDARNYSDECTFRKKRCKDRTDVELAYYGMCQDSCDTVNCVNGTCLEDEKGLPHCLACSKECGEDEVQEMVCGKDGNTYESACHLRLASCRSGRVITKDYNGPCRDSLNCSNFLCMDGHACVMGNKPHCASCPKGDCDGFPLMALCASDDVTYRNLCSMKKVICETRVYLRRKHFGPCAGDLTHIEAMDEEAYFRHYLSLFHHEQVSAPATTALIRRITTEATGSRREGRRRRIKGSKVNLGQVGDESNDDARVRAVALADEAGRGREAFGDYEDREGSREMEAKGNNGIEAATAAADEEDEAGEMK